MTYEQGIQKCLEHFGYVVIGFEIVEGEEHYEPGASTLNVWNEQAPEKFTVTAAATRADWIKQAHFLTSNDAKLTAIGMNPPERGCLFAKLVPTSSKLNIFANANHAGGKP